jgi:hypothetical protein
MNLVWNGRTNMMVIIDFGICQSHDASPEEFIPALTHGE